MSQLTMTEGLTEPKVCTVSELNRQIKGLLEGRFALVWLRGEISNFKAHTSGHHYFCLKDASAQINAVMFKGYNRQLRFQPKDGMEVIVRGRVTVYEPRGNYQIFCEQMEPVGAGALQQAFEKLKLKLKAEGLFAPERKKPLPALPGHVALVTSPTGAAVRDMLHVLERRFRGLRVTVVPCKVQGEGAAQDIVQALRRTVLLHQSDPVDVVICGRGGGSIEDLWAFNEEVLAREIAAFPLPIVSAVGHEIDFTIADFVADLRAPTPSAAAELVVKNAADLQEHLRHLERRLQMKQVQVLREWRGIVSGLERGLVDPKRRLQDLGFRCDDLTQRLETAAVNYLNGRKMQVALLAGKLARPDQRLKRDRARLENAENLLAVRISQKLTDSLHEVHRLSSVLDSLSPLKVVERGYSIVTVDGQVVREAAQIKPEDRVRLRFAKGGAEAVVKKVFKE